MTEGSYLGFDTVFMAHTDLDKYVGDEDVLCSVQGKKDTLSIVASQKGKECKYYSGRYIVYFTKYQTTQFTFPLESKPPVDMVIGDLHRLVLKEIRDMYTEARQGYCTSEAKVKLFVLQPETVVETETEIHAEISLGIVIENLKKKGTNFELL